jgi:Mn-containing catalase
MDDDNEADVKHIYLSEAALNLLDVFNRAQSGELEPFAAYIEKGGRLTPDMRYFLAAYLRGKIKFKKGNRRTIDAIVRDHQRLRRLRSMMEEHGLGKSKAITSLAAELSESESTLKSQVEKAEQEERQGEIEIGPSYR